jgi:hypothetical protein
MLFQGKKITCIIYYKEKKYSFDLERHKTVNDLYNIFTEKADVKNYPFVIMLCSNKNNIIEINNLDSTLLSLERDKNDQILFQFIKSFKCQSCETICDNENKYINNYCLECNQYICSECSKKNSLKHKSHYLVSVDQNNLKDSIKLWNINLNADLSNQITHFNRQVNFINGSDSEVKTNLWLENINKKLKYFQNTLNEIKNKYQELKYIFKESEDMLNKALSNLTKSEQEIYIDLFSKEKMVNKFFSFSEAEKQIQKLKDNYLEIKEVKSKMCSFINLNYIKKYEELLVNIPISLENLSKTNYLILEDLKSLEEKNKTKKDEDVISRKSSDVYLNNNKLFKTSKDTAISLNKMKNKNLCYFNSERKKTDINTNSSGIKDEIARRNKIQFLPLKNQNYSSVLDIRKISSEIKILDTSRNIGNNIKLPKILINDKDKKNINLFNHKIIESRINRGLEYQKSSIFSKKIK